MAEITGMEELQGDVAELVNALANFPAIAAGDVASAIEKALLLLQGRAADYPQAPAGSTYRRTGTLGRRWTSAQRIVESDTGAFVVGRVGNSTYYGPYVQHPTEQAAVHSGRWSTTDEIVADAQVDIAFILEEAGGALVEHLAQEAGA